MATYTGSLDSSQSLGNADVHVGEKHIYGSSRLGILNVNTSTDANTDGQSIYISPWTGVHVPYYSGNKQYELSNHLGNVLATITDKKIGVSLSSDSSLIDHYEADVQTAQDYYPFGMVMPGRMFTALTVPGGSVSGTTQVNGYALPIDLAISSRSGNDPTQYTATNSIELDEGFESGTNDDVTAYIADASYAGTGNGGSDASGVAGQGKYRYGFNGKENDNEVKGIADQIDYGMRVYDSRVGRFLSVDPIAKKYPELTPYQYASNNPVALVDIDGLEGGLYIGGMNESDAEKMAPHIAQVDRDVVNFFVKKHQEGINNVRIAESARVTAINQGRADGDGINWYTKALVYLGPWWNTAAPLSHANDGSVLMTGKNLDNSDASTVDYAAAGIGIFLPVAGTELKKGGSALIEGFIKVFRNGKEVEEAAYKIGKYGYKGTNEYNSIVKAVRSGGNIVANTKEEALKFLKEALPGIADETEKAAASKFGYRIDEFVDKGKDGLKQGHQGTHINYYDKENKVKGTILIDEAPKSKK